MTSNAPGSDPIRGTLSAADGVGTVRLEVRLPVGVEAVWAALTERARLAQWPGELDGDLRRGEDLSSRFFATGWEGTIHVETCERAARMLLLTRSSGEPDCTMEVTLTDTGAETELVFEDRGLPQEHLAAYGAGDQVLLEDLVSYLGGRARCEARTRWQQLHPRYQQRASALG